MSRKGQVLAAIFLSATALAACGGTSTTPTSATAAPTSAIAPTAQALSAGEQQFVADIRSGLGHAGYSNSGTDAEIANVGDQVCTARGNGSSQADVISGSAQIQSQWQLSPAKVVTAAEKDLCPQYLPVAPHVLIRFSGSGIRNSPPFLVNTSTVTVKYSYDCSSAGGSGNFIADMISGSPAGPSYDDQAIANALGASGSTSTTLYPQGVGSDYHLEVNSECDWSIVVKSG